MGMLIKTSEVADRSKILWQIMADCKNNGIVIELCLLNFN